MNTQKVFIIGAGGHVGASAAYAMALRRAACEIVLIDSLAARATAQSMDIMDAAACGGNVVVRAGDYQDIAAGDIVMICAGKAQQPGQTRMDLLAANAQIVRDITAKVVAQSQDIYLVIVTNPVDVMTVVAQQTAGCAPGRVFGTGTALDSDRLRVAIAQQLGVAPSQVQAFTLGEHGDSSFSALYGATVGNIPLRLLPGYSEAWAAELDQTVRHKAYQIIAAKGSTCYGIGRVMSEIAEALTCRQPRIMPLSVPVDGEYGLHGVTLSVPCTISRRGAFPLGHYPLSMAEHSKLQASADIIRSAIASLPSTDGPLAGEPVSVVP